MQPAAIAHAFASSSNVNGYRIGVVQAVPAERERVLPRDHAAHLGMGGYAEAPGNEQRINTEMIPHNRTLW